MKHKVDIVCIQETKKESFEKRICQSMWGDSFVSWDFVPSIQASGGLLCLCGITQIFRWRGGLKAEIF